MTDKTTLTIWLTTLGDKKAAKLLGVDTATTKHWRLGYGLPTSKKMLAIKKLTKSRLTCDGMIAHHYDGGGRRR